MTYRVPRPLLDGVIAHLDPVEVYLFGGHARGDAHDDSDIDLFVVIDDDRAEGLNSSRAIGQARQDYFGAVDIVLSTVSRYEAHKTLIGTLAEIVHDEGRRVYGRDA